MEDDDEDVIDAKRFLDEIAGQELDPGLLSADPEEAAGEK